MQHFNQEEDDVADGNEIDVLDEKAWAQHCAGFYGQAIKDDDDGEGRASPATERPAPAPSKAQPRPRQHAAVEDAEIRPTNVREQALKDAATREQALKDAHAMADVRNLDDEVLSDADRDALRAQQDAFSKDLASLHSRSGGGLPFGNR